MSNKRVKITITDHYRANAETYILCTKRDDGRIIAKGLQLKAARARITTRYASGITRFRFHGEPGVEYGLNETFDDTGEFVAFEKLWVS